MSQIKPWYRILNAAASPRVADVHVDDFIGGWGDDFLGNEDALTAKSFLEDLAAIPDSVKTIRLHVNSPGGDVFAAVNIANALREQRLSKQRTIEVTVEGLAASAASVVIMAGNSITMADNALLMVHNPYSLSMGNASELRKTAERLDKIRDSIIATYRWQSPLSEDKIAAMMDATTWMDADEAIENGFATKKIKGLKAAASFDAGTLAKLSIPDRYRDRFGVSAASVAVPAALGQMGSRRASRVPAGASASWRVPARAPDGTMKIPLADQIKNFENTRAANQARMEAIQSLAADEGRVKNESEREEFTQMKDAIAQIDAELVDLRAMEATAVAAAKPAVGDTAVKASDSRGHVITVKPNVPKGTAFTRYVMALAAGRGSRMEAAMFAKRWEASTPEVAQVLNAAVTAGTTTDSDWAAPLVVYQNMASEFIELLRPATIIGRIPGLRRVPFNITMPRTTQGTSVGWVGQGSPKLVSEMKFDQVSLGMAKAAGIVALAEELVRSSNPSAEDIVRTDLRDTMAEFLDEQFLNPSVAEVANVSPAAVTFGVTPQPSTGNTYADLVTDVKAVFADFTAANIGRAGMVVIMSETQAQALAMMLNALGLRSLPDISMAGGTLFGIPVITSENVPLNGGSPLGGRIIFISAPNVMLADDGGVAIDVSREASLQMNSTPDDPASASTVYVSLWQNNLVGLRAERFINWKKRRDAAVQYINDANYA